MDIKKRDFLAAGLGLGAGLAAVSALNTAQAQPRTSPPVNSDTQPSSVDLNYKPRRLNKCIELWQDNQPIYYTGSGTGPGVDPYEQGKRMCKTWADAVNYEMEHGALDFSALREFMRGMKDGGGTRSGHRFPAVFVSTPIIGLSEQYMLANSWVFSQLLDAGIMGIHVCHARDPDAIEVAAQMACRYPFDYPDTPKLPRQGLRGSSAGYAASIWGVSGNKYCHIADTWPLNPRGELFFGVKIEDTYADKNAAKTLAVKGITMAEWGPGDHSYWLNGLTTIPEENNYPSELAARPEMVAVRQRVLNLCKQHGLRFLNAGRVDDDSVDGILRQLKDGAMVIESNEATATKGREYTKRRMPV
jgi:4-hydroxy-2-oxoheptanedioate aldolase